MNAHDVNQMFLNTLVDYKGVPKLFSGYNEGEKTVALYTVPGGKREIVPFVLEELKPFNKRLGYVNSNTGAIYLYRLATRQWKVGLSWDNIRVAGIDRRAENITFSSPEFWNMVKGDYPSIPDAATIALSFGIPTAFDRQFAVDQTGTVWYRGRAKVGYINESKDGVVFHPQYQSFNSLIGEGYASRFRSA